MRTANSSQATTLSTSPLPALPTTHTRKQFAAPVDRTPFAWAQLPRCEKDTLNCTDKVPVGLLHLVHDIPAKHDVSRAARQLEKAIQAGVVDPAELSNALSAPYPVYQINTCTLAKSVFSKLDERFCKINAEAQLRISGQSEVFEVFKVFNIDERDTFSAYDPEMPKIILYMNQGIVVDFSQLSHEPDSVRALLRDANTLYGHLFPHFGLGDVWKQMSFFMDDKFEEATIITESSDEEITNMHMKTGFFFFDAETPGELRDQAKAYFHALKTQKPTWALEELEEAETTEPPNVSFAREILERCSDLADNFWVNQVRALAQAFIERFPTDDIFSRFHDLRMNSIDDDDELDEMLLDWGICFVTGSDLEWEYIDGEYEARGNNGECPTLSLTWGEHPEYLPELLDNLAWASGVLAGFAMVVNQYKQ